MSRCNRSIESVDDEDDSRTTGSEGSDTEYKEEEEEQMPPGGDSHWWDTLLLGTVLLLFLVRAWHKDYLQYFVWSIKPPAPPLSEFARPFYNGLLWFTSAVFYWLLRMRESVLEWERWHVQRQRQLKKFQRMERRFVRELRSRSLH